MSRARAESALSAAVAQAGVMMDELREVACLIELVSGDRYPHGTRARYVAAKCRCADCRKANSDYAKRRLRADFDGRIVDAAPVRAHLLALSAQGVGRRAVADACDVAITVIGDVRRGAKTGLRADTARRILAVDAGAALDHARIPGKATQSALRELLRLGLTKTEIATRLGSQSKTPSLQLRLGRVTALNAMKVQRLLVEVRAEMALSESIDICTTCGESHAPERRLAWLMTVEGERDDLIEARPCVTRLRRDLATLRERRAA